MIKIKFKSVDLTDDILVKQSTAVKQMKGLLSRLTDATRYRLLTQVDRNILKREGYAQDLIDNVVFLTQRIKAPGISGNDARDAIISGFTLGAFDPSIYACQAIRANLRQLSNDQCAWCETPLNNGGIVSHFRPAEILDVDRETLRSPYFSLAYNQNNLLYSCPDCAEQSKRAFFPVAGKRYPDIELNSESPLLLNPYADNPRDFIRFNPLDGTAYPYDKVSAFFLKHGICPTKIDALLSKYPQIIPVEDCAGASHLHHHKIQKVYNIWSQSHAQQPFRGQVTIDALQLNRPLLLRSRRIQLNTLYQLYVATLNPTLENIHLPVNVENLPLTNKLSIPYRSMAVDALNSWHQNNACDQAMLKDIPENLQCYIADLNKHPIDWERTLNELDMALPVENTIHFPNWLRSGMIYLVLESELEMKNKRRIVFLHDDDRIYGSGNDEKCVCQSIDWDEDCHNVIKVKDGQHIWETSFSELADSRPLETIALFSQSEVWAEGDYPAFS